MFPEAFIESSPTRSLHSVPWHLSTLSQFFLTPSKKIGSCECERVGLVQDVINPQLSFLSNSCRGCRRIRHRPEQWVRWRGEQSHECTCNSCELVTVLRVEISREDDWRILSAVCGCKRQQLSKDGTILEPSRKLVGLRLWVPLEVGSRHHQLHCGISSGR